MISVPLTATFDLPRTLRTGFEKFSAVGCIAAILALVCLAGNDGRVVAGPPAKKVDGNRLTYLDELNPY